MFSVHTTREEFENGGFTFKTNQTFPSTLCQKNLKMQQWERESKRKTRTPLAALPTVMR